MQIRVIFPFLKYYSTKVPQNCSIAQIKRRVNFKGCNFRLP